jgi:carboxymethylenebutenolidase
MTDVTTIEIDTPAGPIDALLDIPEGQGPWPGVVVVHDAIGYGSDKESINARIARAGYIALTPNLFARGGWARCVIKVMRDLSSKRGPALDDVLAARDHLQALPQCTGRVGVAGFCMGGRFALVMSPKGFGASAPFYGTPLPQELSETLDGACPIVASYGGRDLTGKGAPEKLQAASPTATADCGIRLRPGRHRGCVGARVHVLRPTPARRGVAYAGRNSRPTLFCMPPRSLLNRLNTRPTMPYSWAMAS